MKRNYKEEASRWFTMAKDEFEDADGLREAKKFYLALFHFQQAAEKALKAFLFLNVKSTEVFYTHSIDELSKMALEIDKDFKEIRPAKKLDRYYITTRYPNSLPGSVPSRYFDDPLEAKEAMKLTRSVIELVKDKI